MDNNSKEERKKNRENLMSSYNEETAKKRAIINHMAEMQAEEIKHKSNEEQEFLADTVKVISPGRMVLKRFFRSRLSMIGLVTIIVLFLFSFIGPFFSPYGEVEPDKTKGEPVVMESISTYFEKLDAEALLAGDKEGKEKWSLTWYDGNKPKKSGYGYFTKGEEKLEFLYKNDKNIETYYRITVTSRADDGTPTDYEQTSYEVIESVTTVPDYNAYDDPSIKHWLGTDDKGMDILTRLMYGGRISLTLSFLVVILETVIGIVLGGLAGYFGKWVDQIMMRIVDLLYCLPQMPLLLVISAILDGHTDIVPVNQRIYWLMGFLTLLGWAGTARMVRGQILALREQEFMLAAEATGLSPWRKIFKHLIPNVMPQLIVSMTLGLGGVILTESTLSYLGLGVQIPYAAWGTMISLAKDPTILQYYINMWVPPGIMIVLAVLAFNFVGDGLRDAFDPKMKR